jgi:hypothetical protein
MKSVIYVAMAASVLAGCASSPDKIQASYVSPLQYGGYDCAQVQMELGRVAGRVREVAGAQKRQANNDSVAMGVGLVIFWPALFFLAGGNDRKEELAGLKGTYDALTESAIQKKCSFAGELQQTQAPQKTKGK